MSNIDKITLLSTLNDQFFGNSFITISCKNKNTASLFNSSGLKFTFIHNRTRLVIHTCPLVIQSTANLLVNY